VHVTTLLRDVSLSKLIQKPLDYWEPTPTLQDSIVFSIKMTTFSKVHIAFTSLFVPIFPKMIEYRVLPPFESRQVQ
jgi:hypothetical protein